MTADASVGAIDGRRRSYAVTCGFWYSSLNSVILSGRWQHLLFIYSHIKGSARVCVVNEYNKDGHFESKVRGALRRVR